MLCLYSDPSCRINFTHGQGDYIINTILPNSPILQSYPRPYNYNNK